MRRAGPGALAALALLAMVLVTFADALRPSRALFERDILGYWYPHRVALRAALASGQLPLWNPWLGFGAPFLADASSELLYPPTWLALALPFPLQFEILAIGHCLLAAAGAALVARRLVGGVLPAAAAGGAYALAGPLLSALGLYHHFAGAALMPWVLWALESLLQHASARRAILLGTLAAGQVLAGSGDLVLMTALAASARLALHVGGARARGMGALVPRLALAAVLAASLSAVQWLPTVERGASGLRGAQDYRTVTYWSLHPVSLVDLGVPRLVSEATLSGEERLRLFEGREPLFSCLYLGVVTLALGAIALVLRERLALPLAAGASLFVLLGLGRHTPIYGLLLALPGASLMRYPQKYLLPASLCVALLAGVGVGALARGWTEPERRRSRALGWALLGVVLLVTAFAWRQAGDASGAVAALKLGRTALVLSIASLVLLLRGAAAAPRPGLVPAFLLLGAIDLVLVGRGTNDTAPASLYEHQPAALDRFVGASGRLHAAAESAACLAPGAGPAGWPRSWVAALGFVDTLRPPTGIRFGLFGSYDGEFTGLGPRFAAAFAGVVHAGLGRPEALRLLQLGSVEHVAYLGQSAPVGLEPIATLATPLACPLLLLRVPDPLARAYVVGRERDEGSNALAAVLDSGFDPRREVLLPGAAAQADAAAAPGTARIVSRTPNTLTVATQLQAPGVLVVTEAFDEGWSADVDGRPAAVLRANGLFRAVRLGPGEHQVRFRYRPWPVLAGALASTVGAVAAVALAVFRPRSGPPD
ncbi:MAG: YfhO family protein [Vicinamibacterales bacterium]